VIPRDTPKARLLIAAACCALVALPFLVVRFPPITDLPQHVAQVRLFLEAIRDASSPYQIQWFTPYSLVYAVLGFCWALLPPEHVGRIGMLVIGLLWVGAVHVLAARRGRPAAAAVLASLLFFSHVMYWGFYSFAMGWPVFVLWLVLTTRGREEPFRWQDAALLLGTAFLLYLSHALWFAAGLAWLGLSTLAFRVPMRTALLRAASVAPMVIWALVWYRKLAASSFAKPPNWRDAPIIRLTYSWFTEAAFGGLRGPTEYVIVGVLLAWVLVALWQHRRALAHAVDRELLLAGAMFFGFSLVLPTMYQNTMFFAERWVPAAVMLLLIGAPVPALKPALLRTAALGVFAVFCLSTAFVWSSFERREMTGFAGALAALPPGPRVLGLDFVQASLLIKGRPFLQDFAYAQVVRGGRVNFSFASFTPSPVVFKDYQQLPPWTNALEWFPEEVKRSDLQYFDYVLVNALEEDHGTVARQLGLSPVTAEGRWRLYRVAPGQVS
jgi:hypothetical protein